MRNKIIFRLASNLFFLSWVILLASCSSRVAVERIDERNLSARAKAIHNRLFVIDPHVNIEVSFITPEVYQGQKYEKMVTLSKMRAGGVDAAFFVAYIEQGPRTRQGYERAHAETLEKFQLIKQVIDRAGPEKIELALSSEDAQGILAKGKLAAMIGLENGYPLGENIWHLRKFYDLGCRYITLVHNGHNQICDSHINIEGPEAEHYGLSPFGKKVIAEMNRLGMMIDVSHASKEAMLDAARLSKAPVIASHSCCRALCDITRNLDDEQLLALRDNGGVIHIVGVDNFVKKTPEEKTEAIRSLRDEFGLPQDFTPFIRALAEAPKEKRRDYHRRLKEINKKYPVATVKDFVDHIDHAVKIMGIDHVGISSDFFDSEHTLAGWKDIGETFNITLELVRRGYPEEDIRKIMGGNFLRVWREVEDAAEK